MIPKNISTIEEAKFIFETVISSLNLRIYQYPFLKKIKLRFFVKPKQIQSIAFFPPLH